ncbi:MAG: hypothetical protein JWN12_346 [Candidatus Saccharibacteria bacterium]|nr:hypothetical protein [Candidatus Saccharibacteria bacterium]
MVQSPSFKVSFRFVFYTKDTTLMRGEAMAKYSDTSQKKVHKALHEMEEGKLKSGNSGRKVTNRKQAIAIGLSEARKAGAKVPKADS